MYLNSSLQAKLDAPTKAFEVAFRCYVVDRLLAAYHDEASLKAALQNRVNAAKNADHILAGKISSANKLLGGQEWANFWSNINFIQECSLKKEHTENHDVTYLGDTILITYVFQNLYQELIQAYGGPEEYIFLSDKFHSVRNALSHQGSYLLSKEDSGICVTFIENGLGFIDQKNFWFRSSKDIATDIECFAKALLVVPEIDNLDMAPFPTNHIVCREPELSNLFKYVCGWDGHRKLRNRKHLVCVSGYGGVGKTSLVMEFLQRLLDQVLLDTYQGLRPSFILFYSAKTNMMDYDRTSGDLILKNTRSQFADCKGLISCFYKDLGIEGFDDDWQQNGILIIDNLETLNNKERQEIIDFINYDLPTSVQAIITTRIPEHADEQMQLRGFQNDEGLHFIKEYLSKNEITLDLTEEQQRDLVKYSYGNSLVLVLALKRLDSKKSTYKSIISEMKRLPKSNTDSSISHFMFQNTIQEILSNYAQYSETILSVLTCLSLRQEPLTADILTAAHRNRNASVDEVEEILQLLAHYLVVEKLGDAYRINEFANHFILTSMSPPPEGKREWESRLLSAIRETEEQKATVADFKNTYPDLSDVLDEWSGESEEEGLAICHAFSLYETKRRVTRGNAGYELEMLSREFEGIEHQYSAHPYVYYQQARILKELRQEKVIGDEYNDQIKSNYEKCLMMIDTPSFIQIKRTKTYPSVLWIFSMFLLETDHLNEASRYANDAVQNFRQLGITSGDVNDALAVYGIAEAKLFPSEYHINHLRIARDVFKTLSGKKSLAKNIESHKKQLGEELDKYKNIKS